MPQALPVQLLPVTDQSTAVFPVFVTVAVNFCDLLTRTVALVGETETPMAKELPMKICVLRDCERSAKEVAVTVTSGGLGIVGGAV